MVDLCVFLAGQNLDAYVPLFFETLFRNCDTSKLCIHAVEKGSFYYTGDNSEKIPWYVTLDLKYYVPGVGDNVHQYLLNKADKINIPFTIYEMHDVNRFFVRTGPGKPFFWLGSDHAETMNWAMENCGSNKWVLFCHSDMAFRQDIIAWFADNVADDVGMLGLWSHCFAVNREAFYKVGVKFNAISNFRVVPVKHRGFDYEVRHARDPKSEVEGAKILYGWDIGELMELMMIANNWRCMLTSNDLELMMYVDHMCSGHGYVNEETRKSQEHRRQDWLKKYGVQKL